jgi:FKBP-type peptidyl-prolyl cis-trans isomerase FkpA
MKRIRRGALRASACAMVVALAAAGCGSDSPTEPLPFEQIDEVEFHESLGVDLTAMTVTESGLYYQDLVVGDGAEAESGSEATVEYLVRLRNGAGLDSTTVRGPLTFTVGDPGYYAGFNEGVLGMRVGGERKLVVPPQLADGVRGPGGILIFDIELTEVEAETP